MAQWEDLTEPEKTLVLDWMTLLRAASGTLARVLYHLEITRAAYIGPADIVTIMATLDASAVIPNTSGLAGAVDVTKAQLDPMLADLASLLTDYYAAGDLERYVALAGAGNVISG